VSLFPPRPGPARTGRGRDALLAIVLAPIGLAVQWVALCVLIFAAPVVPFALVFVLLVTRRRRVRTRPAIAPRRSSRPAARRRTRTY
jgi:hypothetical protein